MDVKPLATVRNSHFARKPPEPAPSRETVVEVRLTIDRDRLASYLGDIIGTETTQNFDHHVYLLAYTVEGIDPNRPNRASAKSSSGNRVTHNLDEAHDVGASEKVRESATDQRVAASAQADRLR